MSLTHSECAGRSCRTALAIAATLLAVLLVAFPLAARGVELAPGSTLVQPGLPGSIDQTLGLTKTAPIAVEAGDLLTYTIAYTVDGGTAASAVITDRVPTGASYEGCLGGDACQELNRLITWTLPLSLTGSGAVTLTVAVDSPAISGTEIHNTAWFSETGERISATATTVIVDNTPPTSTVVAPADGGWYNALTVLSGTAGDGGGSGVALVEVSIRRDSDGKYWNGTTWTGGGENWLPAAGTASWTWSTGPLNWEHCQGYTVRSRAADLAGHVETPGPGNHFQFDAVKPLSAAEALPPYSGSAPIQIDWSAADLCSGVAQTCLWFKFQPDGAWANSSVCQAGTGGSLGFSPGDGDGAYYFQTIATDEAGNVENLSGGFDAFTIYDTTTPLLTAVSVASDEPAHFYSPELPATGGTVYFNSLAGQGAGQSLTVTVEWNEANKDSLGGSPAFGDSPPPVTAPPWQIVYTVEADAGDQNDVLFTATDKVGLSDAAAITFVQDNVPPESAVTAVPSYTASAPIPVTWSAADGGSGLDQTCLWVAFNVTTTWDSYACSPAISGTFSFSPTQGDGIYYFQTVAADRAGNVEAEPSGNGDAHTVYETLAVGIVYHDPLAGGDTGWYRQDPGAVIDIDFTGGGSSGLDWAQYRVSGGAWQDIFNNSCPSGISDYTAEWTVLWTLLQEGNNPVDIQVRRCFGSWLTHNYPANGFRFRKDTVLPESSASSPPTSQVGATIPITWFASDAGSGVATTCLWFKFGTGSWEPASLPCQADTSGIFGFTPARGPGSYCFQTIATDAAGNSELIQTGSGDTCTEVEKARVYVPLVMKNYSPPRPSWHQGGNMAGVKVYHVAVCPANCQVVYAGTIDGIYKSLNGGLSWALTAQSGTMVYNMLIAPGGCNVAYAATWGSGVQMTADGGATWTPMNNGLGNLYLYSLVQDPGSPQVLYAGTAGDGVYKTDNGGGSWAAINNGLPDETEVSALAIDPHNSSIIYAGTWGRGMYKSTDAGASWSSKGLNDHYIYAVAVDSVQSNVVYAATYQNGIYRSQNGGDNWNQEFLAGGRVYTVAVRGTDRMTFAGTQGPTSVYQRPAGGPWVAMAEQPDSVAELRGLAIGSGSCQALLLAGTTDGVWWYGVD